MTREQQIERFWSRVDQRSDCWIWMGARSKGYGKFVFQGKAWRAHRLSWWILRGPVPGGMVVRHTCDNPPCVRPDHLVLGTSQDNSNDALERGQIRRPTEAEAAARGEVLCQTCRRSKGRARFRDVQTGVCYLCERMAADAAPYLVDPVALLRLVMGVHPAPFRVEKDWTVEVYDANGALVAKCMTHAEADALIAIRGEMDKEHEAGMVEIEKLLAEDE